MSQPPTRRRWTGVELRQIKAAILAAGLLGALPCAAAAGAPARPASTSLLCRTLHQSVQLALAGVLKNDAIFEQADRAFASGQTDRLSLRGFTESIAANLSAATQLLEKKGPQDDDPAARASEELMKSRLLAVASSQSNALNIIESYIQAQDLAEADGESEFSPDRNAPSDFRDRTDPAKPHLDTRVGSPARLLQAARTQIGDLEDSAGIAIMAALKICNSPHS